MLMLLKGAHDELMYQRFENAYKDFRPSEKPAEVIPKGYYKCVDCGKVCKRLNASQKRCVDCQKIHAKELERAYDKKRRR
jgi:hypothetical protein